MTWEDTATNIIKTPKGDYTCESDNLTEEFFKAARMCGYTSFRAFVDDNLVDNPAALHTNSVAALADQARIEGVEPSLRIGSYDKPA